MIYVVILFLLALVPQTVNARIINVPDDRETIHQAIAAAARGDTVLIQPGVYVLDPEAGIGEINIGGREITIGSLYLTTREDHYITETVIDGNGACRVFYILNDEGPGTRLEGLTITGGSATYGAGIYCLGTSPTLSHLVITGNTAIRPGESGGYGGGLYISSRADNENEVAEPLLINCTISGNIGEGGRGGLHYYRNGNPTLVNCIHYDNLDGDEDVSIINEGLNITFSDIQLGYEGEGNIDENPRFSDPEGLDYSLTENSPCVDTGDPDGPEDIDGTRADIGALIYAQTPSIGVNVAELNYGDLNVGLSAELTARISSRGAVLLNVEEIFLIPEDGPFEITEGAEAIDLEAGDHHNITVRFTPLEQGDFEATLVVLNNDPNNQELEIPLVGTGLPPVPDLDVAPNFIIFNEVRIWQPSVAEVTITNTGAAVLELQNLEIVGQDPDLFTVDFENQIDLEPDQQRVFHVTFLPTELSDFSASLLIRHNVPDHDDVNLRLTGSGVLPDQHYEFTAQTGVNHSILVMSAQIDGEDLPLGSEIGVFTPGGRCCGGDYWLADRVGFPAWGDNEITEDLVDGFEDGERINFRMWDADRQEEFVSVARLVQGELQFRSDGVTVVELANGEGPVQDEFTLVLNASWNLISSPIITEEVDVPTLWAPLAENGTLQMIKDQFGRFYSVEFNFCNIPAWNFHEGYQVKMDEADEITFVGEFAAADEPIAVRVGWNIIAYFPEVEVSPMVGFADIVEILEIAKDAVGHFYLPAFGFNNMEDLCRGGGYQIQVTEALDFVWNTEEQILATENTTPGQLEHYPEPVITGRNMSLLVNGAGQIPPGFELGVFSTDGRYLGAVALSGPGPWGVAVWGDDPTTDVVEGALEQERFEFRLQNSEGEGPVTPVWEFGPGAYSTDSFAGLRLPDQPAKPDEFSLIGAFPNPFNSQTEINFALPEASRVVVKVHDLNGRLVEHAVLDITAGYHSYVWQAENLSSGIYLLSLEAVNQSLATKLMLLR